MIRGVGRLRAAAGIGIAITGHDENGQRLCCVRPAAKLTIRAKTRNALVSRRLVGSARNLLLPLSNRPNATKPRKQIVLAMFVFTV
jgi:hypothetical protein